MATVYVPFDVKSLVPNGTAFPQYLRQVGSTTVASVEGWAFDAATDEALLTTFVAIAYGASAGNLTLTLLWYADSASSGVVRWAASIAAITPDTDTQDVETKTFATETTTDDTHLGTTGQRVHTCAVTISNLDSLAANDIVFLRVRRIGSNAADTMTGDAILIGAVLSYSDT